jgi:hypothetical protein
MYAEHKNFSAFALVLLPDFQFENVVLRSGECSGLAIADSFSHEAWVKTNQKNAMQQGGECVVGRLYSCASRPISVRSRGAEPN